MFNEILRNIIKDFRIEFRNPYALYLSLAFAFVSTIAVSLVSRSMPFSPMVLAILFWIIIFFCAMNTLLHIFVREEDQGTSLFLRLNVSVNGVYISKLLFNIIFFLIVVTVITFLFVFFLQVDVKSFFLFILTIISGAIAISASTTILAAMVSKAGGKGALFTVISFPILLPVLWVAISSTIDSLTVQEIYSFENAYFLLAFSGMIIALSFLLFQYIWFEE